MSYLSDLCKKNEKEIIRVLYEMSDTELYGNWIYTGLIDILSKYSKLYNDMLSEEEKFYDKYSKLEENLSEKLYDLLDMYTLAMTTK